MLLIRDLFVERGAVTRNVRWRFWRTLGPSARSGVQPRQHSMAYFLASHRCGVAVANPSVENGIIVSGFCSFQKRKPSGLILRRGHIGVILAAILLDDHGPNVTFCVDSTPCRTHIFSVPAVLFVRRTVHDIFHLHVCAWLETQAQDLPRTCCVNLCP